MLKVGVIGLGYWGPKLARNFHELPEARLTWGSDLDQSRLDHIRRLYPQVRTTRDYREVLASDVDAVCIATPVRTHYSLAMEALRAGKHVLVEKPLAACVKQAEEIIAEGDRQHRTVMVGHTFVYNPAVMAMKEIIASGGLGEVYYINATRVNLGLFQPDINVAWDLAPHDISILLFVLGMEPLTVSARGGAYVQRSKGLHDVAYLSLNFSDNASQFILKTILYVFHTREYFVDEFTSLLFLNVYDFVRTNLDFYLPVVMFDRQYFMN